MSELGREEYVALRATIRQRGTIRIVLGWTSIAVWASVAAWTGLVTTPPGLVRLPLASLPSLLVLVAGFEAIFGLHLTVERIGRYLQVFHEAGPGPSWERVAMEYGRRHPADGPDPLFGTLFLLACALNFLPVALGGGLVPMVAIGALHLAFAARVVSGRRRAGRQRAVDLERFASLRDTAS
jgi:hypothetical protein